MTTAHVIVALAAWLVLTIATFRANRNERRRG
jgi:hypothetical protein